MGFLENLGFKGNKGGKPESPLARQERIQREEIAKEERKRKDRLWERAQLDAQGKQGEPVNMSTAPFSGKQGGSSAEDPYNVKEYLRDERLAMGLPVEEIPVVPPSAIGEARIRRGTFDAEATSSHAGSVLSSEMDAYIQNQMMEEAAAEEARGRDLKPGAEN